MLKRPLSKDLGHTIKYFKGNVENKNKNSYFEFEIKIKDKYYSYGFEAILNSSSITSEWLMEITPDNAQKEIFVRNVSNGTYRNSIIIFSPS